MTGRKQTGLSGQPGGDTPSHLAVRAATSPSRVRLSPCNPLMITVTHRPLPIPKGGGLGEDQPIRPAAPLTCAFCIKKGGMANQTDPGATAQEGGGRGSTAFGGEGATRGFRKCSGEFEGFEQFEGTLVIVKTTRRKALRSTRGAQGIFQKQL